MLPPPPPPPRPPLTDIADQFALTIVAPMMREFARERVNDRQNVPSLYEQSASFAQTVYKIVDALMKERSKE